MSSGPELLVERADGSLTLTLNRPHVSNALSPVLVEMLIDVFAEAHQVRSCVIQAQGRNFCAGLDLSDLESLSDGEVLWRILRVETLLQAVHHAPFDTLALAQGHAVGAGADLFVVCTQRVAAPGCRFSMPGWNFELALGTRRLANLIGNDAARTLLRAPGAVSAAQAAQWGLVSQLAQPDEWQHLISEFRVRSSRLTPFAVASMLSLTRNDTRADDLAAVVQTAGRPGLKERLVQYRQRALHERVTEKAHPA